jgi:hypothetical protein
MALIVFVNGNCFVDDDDDGEGDDNQVPLGLSDHERMVLGLTAAAEIVAVVLFIALVLIWHSKRQRDETYLRLSGY